MKVIQITFISVSDALKDFTIQLLTSTPDCMALTKSVLLHTAEPQYMNLVYFLILWASCETYIQTRVQYFSLQKSLKSSANASQSFNILPRSRLNGRYARMGCSLKVLTR
jgi:hypothetical protein